MSVCATSLVTHGMISCSFAENQLASCDTPEVTGVVEVRPKIRQVLGPQMSVDPKPKHVGAQELKPQMSGQAAPTAPSDDPPKTISAQELKPRIVKIQEE